MKHLKKITCRKLPLVDESDSKDIYQFIIVNNQVTIWVKTSYMAIVTIIWFRTDVSESDRLAMEGGECGANAIIGRQGVAAR